MPVILLGFIPYIFTAAYSTTLRETGKTIEPMKAAIVAVIVNVVLNYVFIYMLEMGVRGAAIATTIARVLELATLLLICEKSKFLEFKAIFVNFRIEKYLSRTIVKKVLAAFGQ